MIDYKSNLTIIKRLVENSEQKLFPRMKKRKEYLDSLLKENPNVPALIAESDLNNNLREHIQLLMNYVTYMEGFIDKNINPSIQSENDYIKVLENELLHEFRQKHNIGK